MTKGAADDSTLMYPQLVSNGRVSFESLCEEVAEQSSLTLWTASYIAWRNTCATVREWTAATSARSASRSVRRALPTPKPTTSPPACASQRWFTPPARSCARCRNRHASSAPCCQPRSATDLTWSDPSRHGGLETRTSGSRKPYFPSQ